MEKIDINKRYKTRDGKDVVIYTTERNNTVYTVVGAMITDDGEHNSIYSWTEDGRLYQGEYSRFDLIEYNPANDLKIDQPIWVRDYETHRWIPRHFSHINFDNGCVECFLDGQTSHTSKENDTGTMIWKLWTDKNPN